ncbi:transglutaminase [Leptolyngbya sp. 'hensonii']|nr:transglutaminase [Leptolyngbya sp. 'hensonii']
MRYQIAHTTTYTYSLPVILQPHLVRLRPRCDGTQSLSAFSLKVSPAPANASPLIDLDGNTPIKLWFPPETVTHLEIAVLSQVETYRTNPFNFLLDPWAIQLPIDYPLSLVSQLQPYLSAADRPIDPIALQLSQELSHTVHNDTISFLSQLNQQIHQTCRHTLRETGDPLPAGLTWNQKLGSCRDFTVLFMEVCRAVGLASRFVSGYQEGEPGWERHLHAWVEVYLPGAGWRGYDPTQGLAVADRHIALVASAHPKYAAPVTGSFAPAAGVQATLKHSLSIQGL